MASDRQEGFTKNFVPRNMDPLPQSGREEHAGQGGIGIKSKGPDADGQKLQAKGLSHGQFPVEIDSPPPSVHGRTRGQADPKRKLPAQGCVFLKNLSGSLNLVHGIAAHPASGMLPLLHQ